MQKHATVSDERAREVFLYESGKFPMDKKESF